MPTLRAYNRRTVANVRSPSNHVALLSFQTTKKNLSAESNTANAAKGGANRLDESSAPSNLMYVHGTMVCTF